MVKRLFPKQQCQFQEMRRISTIHTSSISNFPDTFLNIPE
ncbi:hypothetical protein HMPREF9061_00765 [Actinomyces sp. oral taxon 181 str. F0379]|nr:hypothetical protein HMPREF9061_00765 [Actinomyces sp. oral taxon 181 str. F0379]